MSTPPTTFWSTRLDRHLDGLELLALVAEASDKVAAGSAPPSKLSKQLAIDGLSAMCERGPAAATRQELREDFLQIQAALTAPAKAADIAKAPSPTPPPIPSIEALTPVSAPQFVAARAPSAKQARLLAAATVNDEAATFATLDAMGFKPGAPARRKDAALIKAVQHSIENGHCATTKALWDRCSWNEWKTAAQARVGVARGPMRELVFELSVGDWSFTSKLFPSKQERDKHTQAILKR